MNGPTRIIWTLMIAIYFLRQYEMNDEIIEESRVVNLNIECGIISLCAVVVLWTMYF